MRVPASAALPGSLAVMRALRPLKRTAPDPRLRVIDEEATATASAQSGSVLPVLREAAERWCSVAVVIDTGPAMAVWAKLEAEFLMVLRRLGAFRELQKWYLRTDGGSVLGLSRTNQLASPSGPNQARDPGYGERGRRFTLRRPAELLDPTRPQLVLLLTDGSGRAWYSGEMARVLRLWGMAGPVAIVQPLPQQLWTRTGLAPVRGQLVAPFGAASNARLSFRPGHRPSRWREPTTTGSAAATGIPVPILGLGPEWLHSWAKFVASPTGATLDCAVTLADSGPRSAPALPPASSGGDERVRRFAEQASPEALQLAIYLSGTELNLPVMRLVQSAMLPESGPGHLAEVLLGGLLSTTDSVQSPDHPEEWRYEFADGVRQALRAGLSRSEAHRVLQKVSGIVAARFGHGADQSFTAALAAPPGMAAASLAASSRPFAEVAALLVEGGIEPGTGGQPPPEPPLPPAIRPGRRRRSSAAISVAAGSGISTTRSSCSAPSRRDPWRSARNRRIARFCTVSWPLRYDCVSLPRVSAPTSTRQPTYCALRPRARLQALAAGSAAVRSERGLRPAFRPHQGPRRPGQRRLRGPRRCRRGRSGDGRRSPLCRAARRLPAAAVEVGQRRR